MSALAPADGPILVRGSLVRKHDTIRVGNEYTFAAALPRRFQRVELDAHDRHAKQRRVADCLSEIVADPAAHGFDAQIGASPGFERLHKIGSVMRDCGQRAFPPGSHCPAATTVPFRPMT